MATVKKIKEGLLYISWDAPHNPSSNVYGGYSLRRGQNAGNPIQIQVDVSTLTDVVDSFVFTCQTEEDDEIVVLEMGICIPNKAINRPALIQPGPVPPLTKPNVSTSNPINLTSALGTRQRQSSTRRGVTDPLETVLMTRKPTNQFEWETILIYATKDRVQQKMTFNQSKWTATWDKQCQYCIQEIGCQYCGKSPLGFEILVDLTPDSVISIKKGSQHVLDHLLNLWNTKTLSDVIFNCQGKSVKAHTLILASGSPILAAMFQQNSRENQEKVVAIKDTNPAVFEELLCYIYTGNFNNGRNVDVAELLVAAHKYAVETLKEECALILSRKLTVENAARILDTGPGSSP
ncbi:hypothetical protein DAPPUDRAFT_321315 [Daphnia pulex]|uniref:BTB domain-containing protein n=1 Tax=Daphnia pulex TaxID=6669 RepID=E9GSJ5_DAPPU|nr:hypothetical protein DAPPUDRAFT_321315 [Daphnia pulex]|eukprot:EFX77439.1 hypothetical protein DAPPUDRAFT_321315 [Daphnia pulex]